MDQGTGTQNVEHPYQDIRTQEVYRRESEDADTWTRYCPTPENKPILDVRTQMSCAPPMHAFRVSFKSTTKETGILYKSNLQPMQILPSQILAEHKDNEKDIFERLHRHKLHDNMRKKRPWRD